MALSIAARIAHCEFPVEALVQAIAVAGGKLKHAIVGNQHHNISRGVQHGRADLTGLQMLIDFRAQGRVHKKLERLELDGAEPPAPGTKLTVDGREAEITSAVYSPHFGKVIALAYVRGA